jgi:hypothetical protein
MNYTPYREPPHFVSVPFALATHSIVFVFLQQNAAYICSLRL